MLRICMALIFGLYATDLYATNYWIVFEGFVCPLLLYCMLRICISLIYGLYSTDLHATYYWIVCRGFVFH